MLRRNTPQKQIVYDSIKVLGHASSDDLISYINSNYSDISLATIYRNLSILVEDGIVRKLKYDNNDVYETIKAHHHHFVCKHCGKIIDVLPNELPINLDSIRKISGNSVDENECVFYGTCNECLNKINN